jgi:hypothetical protein
MAWDPALIRKYSSTSHFKLLSQVRSDLKEQPIQRQASGGRGSRSARGGSSSSEAAAPSRSTGRRSPENSGLRRNAAPVSASAENSFDPIMTVPVLTDAFPHL